MTTLLAVLPTVKFLKLIWYETTHLTNVLYDERGEDVSCHVS